MSDFAEPVAFVVTVQPLLLFWVAGISFFVALAGVALVSRGRPWHQLAGLFALSIVVLSVVGVAGAQLLLDLSVLEFEMIRMPNAASV